MAEVKVSRTFDFSGALSRLLSNTIEKDLDSRISEVNLDFLKWKKIALLMSGSEQDSRRKIAYHLKSTFWIALFGFPAGLALCPGCLNELSSFLKVGAFSSILWVVMWKGNEAVSDVLDGKYDWGSQPYHRLITGILGHLVYTVLAMFLINLATYKLFGWNEQALSLQGIINYSIPAVIITFLIASFLNARAFFLAWRQAAVKEERMKSELITSKFQSLKNQVNPHFLFNSLNVLTSLIYKDQDLSAKFVHQLSQVYRYVLEVKDQELVELKDELEFLKSFTFLLKMRHQDGFQIEIKLPQNGNYLVAPLALQMLVENAVKHNMISEASPLKIEISMDDGFLVVRNNLQKKAVRESQSLALGLKNLSERYAAFTDQPVTIVENSEFFEVKIPVFPSA
jgi:signal transduction histidine kinase